MEQNDRSQVPYFKLLRVEINSVPFFPHLVRVFLNISKESHIYAELSFNAVRHSLFSSFCMVVKGELMERRLDSIERKHWMAHH